MRPSAIVAHLLCVPGRTIRCRPIADRGSSAMAPKICVSSPRITSGAPVRVARPDRMVTGMPSSASRAAPAIQVAGSAGQSTYGTSIQPLRDPTMPQSAMPSGSAVARQGPSASRSTASGTAPAAPIPGASHRSVTAPASIRNSRNRLVPQSPTTR